jgi:phosphoenolpyruvate---glycerone phosphotransferase subunit DhaL
MSSAAADRPSVETTTVISVGDLRQAMLAAGGEVAAERDELTALDATAGDGDLGVTLATGFTQVRLALEQCEAADVGALLTETGRTLLRKAPSTIGSLLGLAFVRAGSAFRGAQQLSGADIALLLSVLPETVSERGGAVPGQRTVVDALDGGAVAAREADVAGADAASVLAAAAVGATAAADLTADMEPAFGRAAWLAKRARGSRDAGAVAWAVYLGALSAAVSAASLPRRADSIPGPD